MRKSIFKYPLILFFLFTVFIGSRIVYAVDLSACGTISSAGTYTLTQSISNPGDTCIIVTANNVVIDGGGLYSITGTVSASGADGQNGYSLDLRNMIVNGDVYSNGGIGVGGNGFNGGTITISTSTVDGAVQAVGSAGVDGQNDGGNGGTINIYNSRIGPYIHSVEGGMGGNGTEETSGATGGNGQSSSDPFQSGGNGEDGPHSSNAGNAGHSGVFNIENSIVGGTLNAWGAGGGSGGNTNTNGGNGGDGYSCSNNGEGCNDYSSGGNGGNAVGGNGGNGGNAGTINIRNSTYGVTQIQAGPGGNGGGSSGSGGFGGAGGCDLDGINGCASNGSDGAQLAGNSGSDGALGTLNVNNSGPTITSVASTTSTSSATITFNTDIMASSRINYGLTTNYTATTSISATSSSHSISISGLSPNTTYHYRIRSLGLVNNETVTSDYTFTTASSDATAPTVSNITSDKADGSYSVGEVVDIDVTFSEAVTSTGNVTVTLETGTTDRACTFTISNSTTGSCNYTIQAGDTSSDLTVNSITGTVKDAADNSLVTPATPATNLATNKNIVVDTAAPSLSSGSPSGEQSAGTTGVNLQVTTDESATCKYDTTSGVSYASMSGTFDTTGATIHSESITGLTNGTSYTYYVRCTDGSSNANTSDYTISFSVAGATVSNDDSSRGGGGSSSLKAPKGGWNSKLTPKNNSLELSFSSKKKIKEVRISDNSRFKDFDKIKVSDSSTLLNLPSDFEGSTLYYKLCTSSSKCSKKLTLELPEKSSPNPPSPNPTPVTNSKFTRDLQLGDIGEDVKALQQYLNSQGFTVALTGPGSVGNETWIFGPATKTALIKFQLSKGISPAVGYFGPKTRGYIANN